jgi:CelD/BcsL family acetyltransferase involved in cellulose biosynthesis
LIGVRLIDDFGNWQELAPEWSALVERVPEAHPFQRPEWLIPWWRGWGSGRLSVLAFSGQRRLVGLLPLFVHEWNGRRQVTLIGSGITDYLGLVAEPEYAMQCANLALEHLSGSRGQWDICDWQDLASGSPLLSASPFGLETWPVADSVCTEAPLPANPDGAHAMLPHGLRRTIRLAFRRLNQAGEVRFDKLREDPDGRSVAELIRLHQERWEPQGGPQSMLNTPQSRRQLAEAAAGFAALGMLRIYTLRFDGALIAALLAIAGRDRISGYLTGFDPAFSRYSPGCLILDYARREAVLEGAKVWDFMRGREPYKYLWGAVDVPKHRLFVWHDSRFAPAIQRTESAHYEPVVA